MSSQRDIKLCRKSRVKVSERGVHECMDERTRGRASEGGWGDMFINIRTDHIHTKGSWLSQDIAPDF